MNDKVSENVRAAKRRLRQRNRRKYWPLVAMALIFVIGVSGGYLSKTRPDLILYPVQTQVLSIISNLSPSTPQPPATRTPTETLLPSMTPTITLTITPTATETPTITPTPTPVALTVSSEYLNMRSGPGIIYPVIMSLKRGQVVEFVQCNGSDWVMIRVDGIYGYASRYYFIEKICE